MRRHLSLALALATTVGALAQSPGREQLARGKAFWEQRLAKSAIAALEAAAKDPATAAEAHEELGRLYTFKGWLQDNVFPGWHDEPSVRVKAVDELRAAVAADPSRASAKDALGMAEKYSVSEAIDPAPPRPEVRALDAKIATAPDVVAAVEERVKAQADPQPYFTGAQTLIERGEYDKAIALAARGAAASDRFIDENLSAYQLAGKSRGAYERGKATAADLTGWALFMKKDLAGARAKLEEAARLTQEQDVVNQFHLGELARAQTAPDRAMGYYLNALSIAGGPAPIRQRATQALSALRAAEPNAGASTAFDAWLEAELTRRRDDRRASVLKSLIDKPLPKLTLTTVDGRPYDTRSLQGKVILLNFFASW
jgi:hypothetical protein